MKLSSRYRDIFSRTLSTFVSGMLNPLSPYRPVVIGLFGTLLFGSWTWTAYTSKENLNTKYKGKNAQVEKVVTPVICISSFILLLAGINSINYAKSQDKAMMELHKNLAEEKQEELTAETQDRIDR